jgi:hypothetical protein
MTLKQQKRLLDLHARVVGGATAGECEAARRKLVAPEPAPEHAHATPSIPEAGRGRPVSING